MIIHAHRLRRNRFRQTTRSRTNPRTTRKIYRRSSLWSTNSASMLPQNNTFRTTLSPSVVLRFTTSIYLLLVQWHHRQPKILTHLPSSASKSDHRFLQNVPSLQLSAPVPRNFSVSCNRLDHPCITLSLAIVSFSLPSTPTPHHTGRHITYPRTTRYLGGSAPPSSNLRSALMYE